MRRHGPVVAHCTDSEDFLMHPPFRKWAAADRRKSRRHIWERGLSGEGGSRLTGLRSEAPKRGAETRRVQNVEGGFSISNRLGGASSEKRISVLSTCHRMPLHGLKWIKLLRSAYLC